jgi:hypothetical protein
MKMCQDIRKSEWLLPGSVWLVLLLTTTCVPVITQAEAASNVVLWDTSSRSGDTPRVDDRSGWKIVPNNLFTFEANPPKAASDPGYYGRDYAFTGDAVVENRNLTAVFWSAKGRVVIYSKPNATLPGSAAPQKTLGSKLVEFAPLQLKSRPSTISRCTVLRNAGDEVALEVSFTAPGSATVSAVFFFGKTEIVEIKPAESMKGISLLSPLEYGVLPSFVGDDLILCPADYPSAKTLSIPAENCFLGLLQGENSELMVTWPKGKQQMTLRLSEEQSGKRAIESIDFENDGQSVCLAALAAPGIWHREALAPSFLEKDVTIAWKRPFAAKWKTQLDEAGVRTTFAFKDAKAEIWRGVPGSYSYPVWMNGEDTLYHLSKKVPPKGESLIYFLEGQDTPPTICTPVDILKATLGRPLSSAILDVPGRKLRTHHRRGGDGVHRACTCGCTEAIQAFFEAGKEVEMKEDIAGDLDDMIYFVQCHLDRIDEYRRLADELIQFLAAKGKSSPELRPFVETLEPVAQRIPQEYGVQLENMKSLQHARELARQTLELASKKAPNNLKAYMDLLKAWRAMGGAQDYVLAQCHTITRKLFQDAGYGCVDQPKAVALAEEIRKRCRQCLRNPDGYEIWADY